MVYSCSFLRVFYQYECMCARVSGSHGGQRRALSPLELKFKVVVRCMWVLGT